jgi:sugar phosphate isomerase/epimerase
MKLSVRESGFLEPVSDYPLDWSLGQIKELDYDGVELCMVPDRVGRGPRATRRGTWYSEYDAEGRRKIRQRTESLGLEIPTLSSDWAWGFSEFCPELSQWDRGVEIWGEDVEFARDVGARVILIHFAVATGTWEQAKKLLGRAADHAASRGIVLGYEGSIWHRVGLGGQETLVKMVDEIGSPGLQIYVHPNGDTAKQVKDVEEVGNRICALHSSALNPEIDYSQVFAALKKVGYDWYWCFEVGGELIQQAVQPWRELAKKAGVA